MIRIPTRRRFLLSAAGFAFLTGAKRLFGSISPGREWDLSWLGRLDRPVRVAFDIPDLAGGTAISRAVRTIDELTDLLNLGRDDVAAVFVLRGFAVESARGPMYWRDYAPAVGGSSGETSPGTAALERSAQSLLPADAPRSMERYTIEGIVRDGGIVLVCDRAFQWIVQRVQSVDGSSAVEARSTSLRIRLPGTILMPSGLSALTLAQRAGCSLVTAENR